MRIWIIFLYSLIGLVITTIDFKVGDTCLGTDTGHKARVIQTEADVDQKIEALRERYGGCQYVNGNLELTGLDHDLFYHKDLSFLNSIREVTGYVLIIDVWVKNVSLENLRIIRGNTLFSPTQSSTNLNDDESSGNTAPQNYSLFVSMNYKKGSKDIGMRLLSVKNLSEISKGDVLFENNNFLCYATTDIVWGDILHDQSRQKLRLLNDGGQLTESSPPRAQDEKDWCEPPCHESCKITYQNGGSVVTQAHCWGPGPRNCQKMNKITCSAECERGRCYGNQSNACCHKECAGGCNGPLKTDCWGCKNSYNEGSCEEYCPPDRIYDNVNYKWVPNPNFKFSYGNLCVEKCPPNLLEYGGGCVKSCEENYEVLGNNCSKCDGACPKRCKVNWEIDFVNAHNIHDLEGCTVIDGHIRLLQLSLDGDPANGIPALSFEQLDILSTIIEITEYLLIHSVGHENATNLNFLSNLQTIHGQVRTNNFASLDIADNTYLQYLGLKSLKSVKNGLVLISGNERLCLAESIQWDRIRGREYSNQIRVQNNSLICNQRGIRCDSECAHGCWGPTNSHCMGCSNMRYGDHCLVNCDLPQLYKDPVESVCKDCHVECKGGCIGPEANECHECHNYKDGPYCVDLCPVDEQKGTYKYPNKTTGVCEPCHPNCVGGCDGPDNTVGPGGCKKCHVSRANDDLTIIEECLNITEKCPDGYFANLNSLGPLSDLRGYKVCTRCNPLCELCNMDGFTLPYCSKCRYFQEHQTCVEFCGSSYYTNTTIRECVPCHENCRKGCTGATEYDCINCVNLKVYTDDEPHHSDGESTRNKRDITRDLSDNSTEEVTLSDIISTTISSKPKRQFYCMDQGVTECPKHKPETKHDGYDSICTARQNTEKTGLTQPALIGIIVASIVFFIMIIIAVVTVVALRIISTKKRKAIDKILNGDRHSADPEPILASDAQPDMSKLNLIKESELKRGSILGSGAFGTVYQGVWMPEGDNIKIPVAIKVLQEGTPAHLRKELLDEARVMASVDHPCCVRYIAVCMTEQMMLVTQLMQTGCLLDYVRKNKDNINSKTMLNWCAQIARGMKYLESKGIVHRDLAARNVLVQGSSHVRITDFGLAKLLDYNVREYMDTGSKLPIKWLALESIQSRRFTHKTDVWSYGVTLWEIFTYGNRPYDTVRAVEVPDLLEKGERLPQPPICTIDIYMIMIKCWMIDAESRPSFIELEDEFTKMARDPDRYLVIKGDSLMRPLLDEHKGTLELARTYSNSVDDAPGLLVNAEDYLNFKENGGRKYMNQERVGSLPHVNGHVPNNNMRQRSESLQNHRRGPGYNKFLEDPPNSATLPLLRNSRDVDSGVDSGVNSGSSDHTSRKSAGSLNSLRKHFSCDPSCEETEPLTENQAQIGYGELSLRPVRSKNSTHIGIPPPVFEDDYLQPTSHNPHTALINTPTAYRSPAAGYDHEMDVFEGLSEEGEDEDFPPDHQAPTPSKQNGNAFHFPNTAANMEYFDNVDRNPKQNGHPPRPNRNKHDYYNTIQSAGRPYSPENMTSI